MTEDPSATARLFAALEPLLDQALELAPAERAAWLADLRASNAAKQRRQQPQAAMQADSALARLRRVAPETRVQRR